jgi:hypothetical protein
VDTVLNLRVPKNAGKKFFYVWTEAVLSSNHDSFYKTVFYDKILMQCHNLNIDFYNMLYFNA